MQIYIASKRVLVCTDNGLYAYKRVMIYVSTVEVPILGFSSLV